MKSRTLVLVALVTGTLCAGTAMARGNDDVQWSVTIGSERGAPVYTQPVPVYAHPAPVVVRPVHSGRRYVPHHYRQPTRWDRDGDGIPNRRDRLYNPRWDVDGDRVPNWRDRHDGHRGGWYR